ncbi:hypothetical protein CCR75_004269 [Bremia lactucae]|uniref:Uncharacterized protein n=1 Tax=Bremia lactucae TaxID=4779 RepID=A0A976IDP1_BRELC|nr:hypothetical protein CCR75_004269 [Bremia lactucae]
MAVSFRSILHEFAVVAVKEVKALDFPWDIRQHKWNVPVLPSLIRLSEIATATLQRDLLSRKGIWRGRKCWKFVYGTQIFPALKTFNREIGHRNVTDRFTVPNKSPWPKATQGIRLGSIVASIRSRGTYDRMTLRDKA